MNNTFDVCSKAHAFEERLGAWLRSRREWYRDVYDKHRGSPELVKIIVVAYFTENPDDPEFEAFKRGLDA